MNFLCRIIAVTLLLSGSAHGAQTDFAALMAKPPADSRILKIIHSWPDAAGAQDELIRKLQRQGFGGVVCNVSFDRYLESEEHWHAFTRAVNAAKEAGLAMWLYDERGYPSGNAGGITLRDHPEWEARGLLITDAECDSALVSLDVPPGKLVLAAAFPVRHGAISLTNKVDLSSSVRDGKLHWQGQGAWRVFLVTESRLFEGTHADGNLFAKMPYPNLLMPEPTARFIDVTHQAYASHFGNDLSRYFMGLFTDEPSLMSLFLKPMPYRPLPWSPNLPVEFKKRRGYALDESVLPALATDAGPGTAKFRHDFWLTVGELVSENYFGQLQTWGRAHRVPSGGHLLAEESIAAHTALYGDFFRCIRREDAPSIDCLTSVPPEVPWHIARLLASAAELERHPLVMSETSDHGQRYRPPGDTRPKRVVTEAEIRGTCNRLVVAGVNNITSYYSFTDLDDAALGRINEWVGRCCALLRGGHQVADIAVLYPSETLWTRFIPSHHWAREAAACERIEGSYRAAADALFASQRDFTFVDGRALAEAKVQSGALVHGDLRWRIVVLPAADTLPLAAWENLARFVRSGGVVIALGALPANSETEFPSARVQALAKETFGATGAEPFSQTNAGHGAGIFLPHNSEGLLALVLDGLLDKDVKLDAKRAPVRITHRHIDNHEIYFLINDSGKAWAGDATFAATGPIEEWNPATGERFLHDASGRVHLNFVPYGAALFRLAETRLPRRHETGQGALPGITFRSLPAVAPVEGHGEFVRAQLEGDANRSRPEVPAWRAAATLTRSKVDTHLFTLFRFDQPLDLSAAECLALETWVPEGQKTAAQLLVIVHEEGGGDFVATTARSLGAPAYEKVFVPLTRFELAGWSRSNDADGILDLRRVRDIRIGWGGYFGTSGEKIEFTIASPQVGSLRLGHVENSSR